MSNDQLFSDFIRTRDNWECQPCKLEKKSRRFRPPQRILEKYGGYHDRHKPPEGLHNMHCFGRGSKSTRFVEDNCLAGCVSCHAYLDTHPYEKKALFESVLGTTRYKKLLLRSNQPEKIDPKIIKEYYQMKLDKLLVNKKDAKKNIKKEN